MFEFLKKYREAAARSDGCSLPETEMIEYALQFESILSDMESHFRNTPDHCEVACRTLKLLCEFHQGDWAGVILVDLGCSIWKPYWWYNPASTDHTNELVKDFEPFTGWERWVQCIRDNKPLVLTDVESIKESHTDEYNLYKRFLIQSFIAIPIVQNSSGFLVVRNPQKFIDQTSLLKIISCLVGTAIQDNRRMEYQKIMEAPWKLKTPNEIVIRLFGSLEIYTSKGIISEEQIRSPKLCKILVYLLLSKRTVHQPTAIANALWPDEEHDIEKICSNIRGLVYRFRKPFQQISDEALIINTQAGYRLNPKLRILTDFELFEKLSNDALHTPEKMRRIDLMKQAINLYRGAFFASSNTDGWVQTTANGLTLRYIYLMNKILFILAEMGDIDGVHHYAQRCIEFTPENVMAHFWLIHSVQCGPIPGVIPMELEWLKVHLTNDEYQDLLRLLEKAKKSGTLSSVQL